MKEAERLNQVHKLVLGSLKIVPISADLGKGGIYVRLRSGPLNDLAATASLCRKLLARKQRCIVAKN